MGIKSRKPMLPATRTVGGRDIDSEALLRECESALDKLLEQHVDETDSFETSEQTVLKVVHEIARRKLEQKLQSIADSFPDRLAVDHNPGHGGLDDTAAAYRRHCPGTADHRSLVGPLRVRRSTYRACISLETCVPLDLAAGLMERMTPALARCVAIGYAHMPSRACEELLVAGGLRPPSRSTLDRTTRDLGEYAVRV